MNKKTLNMLESMPFFAKAALLPIERVSENTLSQNLKRWVKIGLLIRLKNGLYVTKTFADRSSNTATYLELLAGRLLSPSYLSLEYVLQKNGLLTEATYTITSVTLKSSRKFKNDLGSFVYHSISRSLYFGFVQRRSGKNIFFEASPAKALFDYIYLRMGATHPSDTSTIEELRINWSSLTTSDFADFCRIVKKSGIKKMSAICRVIKENFYGHTDR